MLISFKNMKMKSLSFRTNYKTIKMIKFKDQGCYHKLKPIALVNLLRKMNNFRKDFNEQENIII